MSPKLLCRIIVALVLLALVAACNPFVPTVNLDGSEWILTSLNGAGLIPGTNISLSFSEGKASGFSGCNAYHGPYTASYSTLKISQLAITAMACAGPAAVMQQEQAYADTLQNAAAFRIVGDRLEISNRAGVVILVFKRKARLAMNPHDLLDTRWQLVSMNGAKPVAGSTITLEFVSESQVGGHAGCRDYSASYVASGDKIDFQTTEMIGDVCPSTALLDQEGQYTTILSWTNNYRLSKDQLEFSSERGDVLTYVPLASSQPNPTPTAKSINRSNSGGLGELAYVVQGDLWIRALPDGQPKRLTTGGGITSPLWSPSGEWLALRKSDGRVWVMRESGEGATALADTGSGLMFAWSPVADTLAFNTSNASLSIAGAPAWHAQSVAIVQDKEGAIFPFAWSPDGAWLAFSEWHSPGRGQTVEIPPRPASIQKVRPDGRDRTVLLATGSPFDDGLQLAGWSRDLRELYYWPDPMFSASLLADGWELWAVSSDGSSATRKLGPSTLLYPDFWSDSPDGKTLAVAEGVGRETWTHKRIAIVDRSSGQLTYLTDSKTAAFSPAWSPDGQSLAYVAGPDTGYVGGGDPAKAAAAQRRIWIMNKDGSGQHPLTRDAAYRDEFPQWSRDGQFILFARLNASGEASVWIVPAEGGAPTQVAGGSSSGPLGGWFGFYGRLDWSRVFDWWQGP